jgi:hypothetical protein
MAGNLSRRRQIGHIFPLRGDSAAGYLVGDVQATQRGPCLIVTAPKKATASAFSFSPAAKPGTCSTFPSCRRQTSWGNRNIRTQV